MEDFIYPSYLPSVGTKGYNSIMTSIEQEKNVRMAAWMPVLSDVLTMGALFLLLPLISDWFAQPSGWLVPALVVFYLLFCIGVFLIRKLEPVAGLGGHQVPQILLNRRLRAGLAVLFGLLMMTTLAFQLGYFSSIQSVGSAQLDEGASSSLFVYMPGALLGFSMFYVLVLAFDVNENIEGGSRKAAVNALIGTLLMNSFLLFWLAQLRMVFMTLGYLGSGGMFILGFIALILTFAPPRLILQNKYPLDWALISFVFVLVGSAVWLSV